MTTKIKVRSPISVTDRGIIRGKVYDAIVVFKFGEIWDVTAVAIPELNIGYALTNEGNTTSGITCEYLDSKYLWEVVSDAN